ncbi:MAG: hypothetical protein R2774_04335 [Saprospiraceae bacterium]
MSTKNILAIVVAFIWISISEFIRNSYLVHSHWIEHFGKLGIAFPEAPVNGAVWGLWSLVFAILIYTIYQRFTFLETFVIGWVVGFVMMWLVIGNLGVLPYSILPIAIPLSMLEVFLTIYLIKWISKKQV